jgi:hypothetical protein
MDNIKAFINNPFSVLFAGATAGGFAGYQLGLREGRK